MILIDIYDIRFLYMNVILKTIYIIYIYYIIFIIYYIYNKYIINYIFYNLKIESILNFILLILFKKNIFFLSFL